MGSTFSPSGTQSEGRRSKFIYSSKQSLVTDIHYHPDPCDNQSVGEREGKKKDMVVKGCTLSSYLIIRFMGNTVRNKTKHNGQCSESVLDAESAIMCEQCNRSDYACPAV